MALERKVVLVLVWESQETQVRHQRLWYDISCYSGFKPQYSRPTIKDKNQYERNFLCKQHLSHALQKSNFNPFPDKPWFLCVFSVSLLKKIVGKGEIASDKQFLFFPQCVLVVWKTFCHFRQIWNWHLKKSAVWKRLKFVAWERVNAFAVCYGHKHFAIFEYLMCQRQILPHDSASCLTAKPHSSVGSVVYLRTGGLQFDPWLAQYSFQGLMIVIATGFILLSPLSIVSSMIM